MKRATVTGGLRVACGLGLVAVLLWQAAANDVFTELQAHPPDPKWLGVAWVAILVSLVLSFMRWRWIAEAAGVEMTLPEALRLGAIGFACNFVALGSVGGDVVKAALLAKSRPGQRGAAVTTVVVDRLFGLLGFLCLATVAILATGAAGGETPTALNVLSRATLAAAAAAVGGFVALVSPGRPLAWIASRLRGFPALGGVAGRLGELASVYGSGRRSLFKALAVGLSMNTMFILSFCAAAQSLPLKVPDLADQFFAAPLAILSGALPISPNGLGTIEATTDYMYRTLEPASPAGAGTLAALCHRLAMLVAGVTCAGYYATVRRKNDAAISEAIHEAANEETSGTVADST